MSKTLSARTSRTPGSRRQAYLLIALGVVFLVGAWLFHLNPSTYPIGLLLFGAGMLVAALLNPYRLLLGGLLVTLVGLSIFFSFKPVIPDGGSTLLLAIGLGLLAIALAARRGYIGRGAITPAVIVLVIGLVEYPPSARFLPANFATFILSLWFPGFGLLLLGILSLSSVGERIVLGQQPGNVLKRRTRAIASNFRNRLYRLLHKKLALKMLLCRRTLQAA